MTVGVTKYVEDLSFEIKVQKYKDILTDALVSLTDEIAQGARLKLPEIGVLGVTAAKNTFNKPKLSRAQSMNARKAIIDRGGTPKAYIRNEAGEIIGDNGGEEWAVFYTQDIVCQLKINSSNTVSIGTERFKFKPHRDFSKKVYNFVTTNPLKERAYEINFK